MSLPILTSFIYLLGVTPLHIDPVPVVMFITNALYLWAIMSFQLFKLSPIAMERVFEHMSEGVLILDRYRTLIDYNPAAASIIPALANKRELAIKSTIFSQQSSKIQRSFNGCALRRIIRNMI